MASLSAKAGPAEEEGHVSEVAAAEEPEHNTESAATKEPDDPLGSPATRNMPWLLKMLINSKTDNRLTRISSELSEDIVTRSAADQMTVSCKRWQLQLELLYTYVYGTLYVPNIPPKAEKDVFQDTGAAASTEEGTLTAGAKGWLKKLDAFIASCHIHGDRELRPGSVTHKRFRQKWRHFPDILRHHSALADVCEYNVTKLRDIAVYNTYTGDGKEKEDPGIELWSPGGWGHGFKLPLENDPRTMVMHSMCIVTPGSGYEGGVGAIDHFFTIIVDKENERYYLNSSYGATGVQVDQRTLPLDMGRFYTFCYLIQNYAGWGDDERKFVRDFYHEFFLEGGRRWLPRDLDEARTKKEWHEGVGPDEGAAEYLRTLFRGVMDGTQTTQVGWIQDYGNLLDTTIGIVDKALALDAKETKAHAAKALQRRWRLRSRAKRNEGETSAGPGGGGKIRRRRKTKRRSRHRKRGTRRRRHSRKRSVRHRKQNKRRTRRAGGNNPITKMYKYVSSISPFLHGRAPTDAEKEAQNKLRQEKQQEQQDTAMGIGDAHAGLLYAKTVVGTPNPSQLEAIRNSALGTRASS